MRLLYKSIDLELLNVLRNVEENKSFFFLRFVLTFFDVKRQVLNETQDLQASQNMFQVIFVLMISYIKNIFSYR